MRRLLKGLIWLVLVALFCVLGYVAYVLLSYHRVEDNLALKPAGAADKRLTAGEEYSALSWNMGFGAYSDDYSFFMDGGRYARALSREAVLENTGAMLGEMLRADADILLLQEVDLCSTRSYGVDQAQLVRDAFPGLESLFAINYDSAYLFYPFTQPIGRSKSGMMTLSAFPMESAVRRSLPVESGFMKLLDLDRCYTVTRIPVGNGRTLCVYNLHLSAYTSDGVVATEQLELLLSDMRGEYERGNYALAGGDFNKDLLGNSPEVFGVSGEAYTWAQPFPEESLPDGVRLVRPLGGQEPVPSCRNADGPYAAGQSFVLTVDGFLLSDNVEALDCAVTDLAFANSDHNPVILRFRLKV